MSHGCGSLRKYNKRLRMAARLWAAWPGLLALTLASVLALHVLGLSGPWLVLIPALGGLLLTLAVALQARHCAPGAPACGQWACSSCAVTPDGLNALIESQALSLFARHSSAPESQPGSPRAAGS